MEKNISRNIRLGIFVVAGLFFLTLGIYYIGNKQNLFGGTFHLSSIFNNVNGLQPGNNVRYSGINVGTVSRISIINDTIIKVEMIIQNDVRKFIKKDAIAMIGSDGLMGNKLVNIAPGPGLLQMVEDGDKIESFSQFNTDDIISTFNSSNENIALITSNLAQITDQTNKGKGTVGAIFKDQQLADNIKITAENLAQSSQKSVEIINRFSKLLRHVERGEGMAGVLLKDTTFGNRLNQTMFYLQRTGLELEKLIIQLENVSKDFQKGDGTMGLLLNDTAMAQNLSETMENIKSGTDKFDENMEALKHNILFRRYFRKMEKKAKKAEKEKLKSHSPKDSIK